MAMGQTRRGITLIDVLAIIAVILVVIVLATPRVIVCGESAVRVKCASNLKQIGLALTLYMNDHGEWPRTRYAPESADRPTCWTAPGSTTPFSDTGPAVNDITAAYRLLLAHEDLVPEVFLCTQSPVADLDFARQRFKREHANFIDERELSYSFANPYPTASVQAKGYKLSPALTAEFAVAADVNPGQNDAGGVLSAGPTSSARDTRPANTPNHDRDGQNVLYGDGHVEFTQNPFVGVDRDNIYAYGKKDDAAMGYGIVGSPAHAADSVLLPAMNAELWRSVQLRRNTISVAWIVVPLSLIAALFTWATIAMRRARPARQSAAIA